MDNAFRPGESRTQHDRLDGPSEQMREGMPTEGFLDAATEIMNRFRGVSGDAMRDTLDFVKRYPVHSAIGAAAVGFCAGFLLKRRK